MTDLKLDFLGVSVKNFQRSLEFYTKVIGVKLAAFYPEWGEWAGLGRTWDEHHKGTPRGLMMELFGSERVTPKRRKWGRGQGIRPSIQVADLRETVARLRRRGVRFTGEIEYASWGQRIEFLAPEQIRWTLASAPGYANSRSLSNPRIGRVELKVRDIKVSTRFYHEVMGMKLKEETDFRAVLKQGRGEALLMLESGGKQSPADPGWRIYSGWGQPVWISFSSSDIKAASAWLKTNRVKIIKGLKYHPAWGGTDMNIMDPDGNRIQVVQY